MTAELRLLNQGAANVFVGQITAIQREPGAVKVLFRVEQPVRGTTQSTFVLREWGGLWAPGHLRYQVGQRVLAFVHGAGAAGFSSPVHGAEGLIPVVVGGARAPQLLDIRRLAASVIRAPGTPLPTEQEGGIELSAVLSLLHAAPAQQQLAVGRRRLPLRGEPPTTLVPPVILQSSSGPTAGKEHLPLSAPVLLRSSAHVAR